MINGRLTIKDSLGSPSIATLDSILSACAKCMDGANEHSVRGKRKAEAAMASRLIMGHLKGHKHSAVWTILAVPGAVVAAIWIFVKDPQSLQMLGLQLLMVIGWLCFVRSKRDRLDNLVATHGGLLSLTAEQCLSCTHPLAGLVPDNKGVRCPECGSTWHAPQPFAKTSITTA